MSMIAREMPFRSRDQLGKLRPPSVEPGLYACKNVWGSGHTTRAVCPVGRGGCRRDSRMQFSAGFPGLNEGRHLGAHQILAQLTR